MRCWSRFIGTGQQMGIPALALMYMLTEDQRYAGRINFLNVMQMGSSEFNDFDTLEHIDENQISGVRIDNWAVVFSDEESLCERVQYT